MRKIFKSFCAIGLLLACLSVRLITGFAYDKSLEVNDTALISSYYRDVNVKLTGEAFRSSLSTIISKDYKYYPYSGSSTDVATILRESDADPSGNGNVICIYTGLSMPSDQRNGVYDWDKEHVWAKSHGFPSSKYEKTNPYSDAHNLRPALATVNQSRSNKDHGVVTNPTWVDDYGNKQDALTFEPRDESKGDVARIMLYMATRYGFDEFNLTLVDDKNTEASDLNGRFGNLQLLLQWHYQDPVSTSEIYRNNVVYGYQRNRNPYIDHPEYVDLAYPNNYSSTIIDETKVQSAIQAIGTLPSAITLNDEAKVNEVKAIYDSLNSLEQAQVTNSDVLINALKTIDELKGIISDGDYSYSIGSKVFSANSQTVTLKGVEWTLDGTLKNTSGYWAYSTDKGQQFGSTNNPYTRLKLTSTEFTRVTRVILSCSGASGVSAVLSCRVGDSLCSDTYNLSNETKAYSFTFDKRNGAVSFEIENNSDKAIYISKIDIFYSEVDLVGEAFMAEETASSLRLDYDLATLTATDVDLRFGARISASSFSEDAKYGVVILDSSRADVLVRGEQSVSTIGALIDEGYYVEITPVRVNEQGIADDNGEYYQFAWVISNMEGHYSKSLSAVIYMEHKGKVYFAGLKTISLIGVAQNYLDQNLIEDNNIKIVLQKIIDGNKQDSGWLPWV